MLAVERGINAESRFTCFDARDDSKRSIVKRSIVRRLCRQREGNDYCGSV